MTDINQIIACLRMNHEHGTSAAAQDARALLAHIDAQAAEIERLKSEFERLSTLEHNTHKLLVAEQWATSSLRSEIERLRAALSGLVGTDDQTELDEIRATLMLIVSDDDGDKAALLTAIDALKEKS